MAVKYIVAFTSCLTLLSGCDRTSMPPTERTDDASTDWVVLFNGTDLAGWRSYGMTSVNSGWIVEDGAIVLDANPSTTQTTGGDLITDNQFENFELELEWKISEGGNSGIFFAVQEIDGQRVAHETGIEMQILDDDKHPDGARAETSAGASYALYAPETDVVRPVGEYNEARLVVHNSFVEHWLNGTKIVDYQIGSADWTERVAASKFAEWEHFARYKNGHIALQDHTDRVWFRNIRIKKL